MTDVFDGNPEEAEAQITAPEETPTDRPIEDPFKGLLDEITAPDGRVKFNSTEDALKSIPHQNSKILELTNQVNQLKEQLSGARSVDELWDRMNKTDDQNKTVQEETRETPSQPTLNEDTIRELARKELAETRKQEQEQANRAQVREALIKKYGDKAKSIYEGKAGDLGISVQSLNQLAAASPKAALAFFESDVGAPASSNASSNTSNFRKSAEERPATPSIFTGGGVSSDVEAMRKIKARYNNQ